MSDVNRNVLFSSFCSPLCQGTPHPFVLLLFLIEVVSYKKKKNMFPCYANQTYSLEFV